MKHEALDRGASPLGGDAQRGEQPEQLRLFQVAQTELTSDDYYTPKWIFDAMKIEFDLDVACPPEGPLHTPCRAYYTQADDGLASPWNGRVFMNPPFSNTTPWIRKFTAHANGIAVVQVSKALWFDQLWNDCDGIVILPARLKYVDPTGGNGSISIASSIVAFGVENVQAISRLGRVR